MKTEIDHAVSFILDTMRNKMPQTSDLQLQEMGTNLTQGLEKRYDNHWYADKPLKGSAFRCINISIDDHSVDLALRTAAAHIGITEQQLLAAFPKGLALWVDPGDVSGQMGKGPIFPIYKKIAENKENDASSVTSSSPVTSPSGNTAAGGKKHRPMLRPRLTCPPFDVPSTQKVIKTSPTIPKSSHSTTTNNNNTSASKTTAKLSGTSPEFRSAMTSPAANVTSSATVRSQSNSPYGECSPEYGEEGTGDDKLDSLRRGSVPYPSGGAQPAEGGYYSPQDAFYDFNQYVTYYDNYASQYHPNFRQRSSGQLYFPC